jgi:hypothetical protein
MKSNLADVMVVKHHETPAAVLVSSDGHRDKAVWLPKGAVEEADTGRSQMETIDPPSRFSPKRCPIIEITAPQRLLEDKGLV